MIVKCSVTQAMIDEDCHAGNNCPVAQAILSQCKPRVFAMVSSTYMALHHVTADERWEQLLGIPTPWNVSTWIRAYDERCPHTTLSGVSVHPFEFELNVPPEAVA